MSFKDQNEQWYYKCSDTVVLCGYNPRIPQITVVPRVKSTNLGDTVVFDYHISNIEQYKDLKGWIGVYVTDEINECQFSSNGYRELTDLEGSFEYNVLYGYGICAEINITDMNGQVYIVLPDAVLINNAGSPFILPDGLRQIGSEAFADVEIENGVLIPAGIVSISDDAFGKRNYLIIYGTPGTEAEFFANRHDGFTFIPVE